MKRTTKALSVLCLAIPSLCVFADTEGNLAIHIVGDSKQGASAHAEGGQTNSVYAGTFGQINTMGQISGPGMSGSIIGTGQNASEALGRDKADAYGDIHTASELGLSFTPSNGKVEGLSYGWQDTHAVVDHGQSLANSTGTAKFQGILCSTCFQGIVSGDSVAQAVNQGSTTNTDGKSSVSGDDYAQGGIRFGNGLLPLE